MQKLSDSSFTLSKLIKSQQKKLCILDLLTHSFYDYIILEILIPKQFIWKQLRKLGGHQTSHEIYLNYLDVIFLNYGLSLSKEKIND